MLIEWTLFVVWHFLLPLVFQVVFEGHVFTLLFFLQLTISGVILLIVIEQNGEVGAFIEVTHEVAHSNNRINTEFLCLLVRYFHAKIGRLIFISFLCMLIDRLISREVVSILSLMLVALRWTDFKVVKNRLIPDISWILWLARSMARTKSVALMASIAVDIDLITDLCKLLKQNTDLLKQVVGPERGANR